jgi:hypothetical protein
MKILTAIGLFCLIATAAHAGEPWPENVCHALDGYAQRDVKRYGTNPVTLAFARTNVLNMLRVHCGVDTTATMKADVAATNSAPSPGGGGTIDPDDLAEINRALAGERKRSTHCTSFPMGGGMAAIDCD